MGHRDSTDPAKMEIDDSATFSSNGDSVGEGASHETDPTSSSSVNAPPFPTTDTSEKKGNQKEKLKKRGEK